MEYKNNKNNSKYSFLAFIAFFLIFISSFITILSAKNKNSIFSQITKIFFPTSTITVDKNKNWKTYTNSTYKFSIQYPQNWILSQSKNDLISLASSERNKMIEQKPKAYEPEITIIFYNSFSKLPENSNAESTTKNTKTLEQYIKSSSPDVEKININGATGFSIYNGQVIYLQNKKNIIRIIENLTENYQYENSPVQQIINSIKFN